MGRRDRLSAAVEKMRKRKQQARSVARIASHAKMTGVPLPAGMVDDVVGAIATVVSPEAGAEFLAGVMFQRAARRFSEPDAYFRYMSRRWFETHTPPVELFERVEDMPPLWKGRNDER